MAAYLAVWRVAMTEELTAEMSVEMLEKMKVELLADQMAESRD